MRTWPAIEIDTGREQPTAEAEHNQRDLIAATLADFDVAAIDEGDGDRWRVFFQNDLERDRALSGLRRDFPALPLNVIDVADEDWAARSQAALRAVRVGRVVVSPPWDKRSPKGNLGSAISDSDTIEIVIQPSMGFGTGHHATTRLCLAALQQIDLHGKSVVDVGTGSGVLAIAARLLGAASVLGIDDDADAIQSARESLSLNGNIAVELQVAALDRVVLTPVDIVVANLTGGLLMRAADRLTDLVAPTGRLIISGFTQAENVGVLAAFSTWRVADTRQEEEWMCAVLQRPGAFT